MGRGMVKPRKSITMKSNRPILYQCREAIKPGVGISLSNLVSRDKLLVPPAPRYGGQGRGDLPVHLGSRTLKRITRKLGIEEQ